MSIYNEYTNGSIASLSFMISFENGLKLLLCKVGEKDFENTECKIKAVEILKIPVVGGREDYSIV